MDASGAFGTRWQVALLYRTQAPVPRLAVRTEVVCMARTHASHEVQFRAADSGIRRVAVAGPETADKARHVPPFWRHFLQMLAAMMIGMIATGAIFLSAVGVKTWDEVTTTYPTQALLAMAAGMTIPMVAWMVYRGMGWRNSYEMAAVMVVPVVPFLCLVWLHVTSGAACGAYCAVSIVAMLGLMTYRRTQYTGAVPRRQARS
jgi:hypothetical protein